MKHTGTICCIWYRCYGTEPFGAIAGTYRMVFFSGLKGVVIPSINAVVNDFGDLVEVPA